MKNKQKADELAMNCEEAQQNTYAKYTFQLITSVENKIKPENSHSSDTETFSQNLTRI